MNKSNDVLTMWGKINKKSKKWHMFIRTALLRNVPMMFALIIMIELIYGYRKENLYLLIVSAIGKMILAYLAGVYAGYLEWNMLKEW